MCFGDLHFCEKCGHIYGRGTECLRSFDEFDELSKRVSQEE